MATITLKQTVKLFTDENLIGDQEVHIDTEDPDGTWISVIHDGNEFSMNMDNWNKLIELVERAKAECK
jgi:hypothetical protein